LQLDPAQYRENRIKAVVAKKAAGENPYPHKFQVLNHCQLQGLARLPMYMPAHSVVCSCVCAALLQVSMSVPDYIAKYESLETGSQLTDVVVSIAGVCWLYDIGAWQHKVM
jgi:lysyl-tRNA synthetase class 2